MKPFDDGCAANDEFQSADTGNHRGELIRGLLKQRVRIPEPPAGSLARPLLSQTITTALKPGAILFVEAPAGFGKSHALCSALINSDRSPEQVKWISLTGQDNDPGRLLSLLHIALNPEPLDDKTGGLQKAGNFADALALSLAHPYWQSPDTNGVLVIDNVGEIGSSSALALLQQLVEASPPGLAVALVSRKPLPFETHTYELEDRFKRIGAGSLELSRAETFELFRSALQSSKLTTVAVDHLYALTEGWLTPLALYQRELDASSGSRLPMEETASIERFLRDTVLGRLTPAQQRSLQVMAELEIVSDELFLALEEPAIDQVFRPSMAADAGLPLRALPGRGRWLRLNPLLQEWLRTPALEGASARSLKASRWFSRRNQFPEALRYALLSGIPEEAIKIASEGSEALLLGQDTASLLRLRKSLPVGLLEKSARLRIVYGWVHAIGGQFRQARKLIERIGSTEQPELAGRVNALRAFILRGEGSVDEALEMAERALEVEELSIQARLVTLLVKSSALCAAGRFGEARDANRAAARIAREAGDKGSEVLAVYAHARIELGKGSLKHAEQLLRTGLDTAMNELSRPARIGETRLQLNLVLILWHQGREAEADQLLATCSRHAEQTRDLGLLLAMALRALVCRNQDRLDDAFAWIGRAERTMQSWQVDEAVYLPVLEALKASCWLAMGQPDSAAQAMDRLQPYRVNRCVPELFPMMPGLLDCLKARVELARGDHVKAEETIRQIRHASDYPLSFGLDIHSRLLEAVVQWHAKGAPVAQKVLAATVAMAADEHFISPFSEMRDELRELMEKTLPTLPESRFTDALAGLYDFAPAREGGVELAEPISDREHGVLELIAMGLSNQDIADRLHISLHTVKTHARRINAKLDVKSRTQAIVRARELGLL